MMLAQTEFSFFFFIVIVAIAVWAISASKKMRRQLPHGDPRACINCGTVQPAHAHFCRHCGRKL